MDEGIELRQYDTFVLRVVAGGGSDARGQLEHLPSGTTRRFQGLEELGRAIVRMSQATRNEKSVGPETRQP